MVLCILMFIIQFLDNKREETKYPMDSVILIA
jgi:hypothetical protein